MGRRSAFTLLEQRQFTGDYRRGQCIRDIAARAKLSVAGIRKLLIRNGVLLADTKRSEMRKPPLGLQPPQFPPVVTLIPGHLAVVVIDPDVWDVDSIQRNQGVPHAKATKVIRDYYTGLLQAVPRVLFLWKNEVDSPGLQQMIAHRAQAAVSICSARQAEVIKLAAAEANRFYTANHLQGRCNGKFHYALRYKDNVVAVMSFTDARACRGPVDTFLLQRFAVAGSVPGAASRLLAAFRREHPGPIVSYSDERYASGGKLYETLGFTCTRVEKPDYRYWRDNRWYAKNQKQRKHLIAELALRGETPTPEDTEFTMARRLGYKRCFDCGKRTWLLDNAALPLSSQV